MIKNKCIETALTRSITYYYQVLYDLCPHVTHTTVGLLHHKCVNNAVSCHDVHCNLMGPQSSACTLYHSTFFFSTELQFILMKQREQRESQDDFNVSYLQIRNSSFLLSF